MIKIAIKKINLKMIAGVCIKIIGMTNKKLKRSFTFLLLRKCKLQPEWDSTAHLFEWLIHKNKNKIKKPNDTER